MGVRCGKRFIVAGIQARRMEELEIRVSVQWRARGGQGSEFRGRSVLANVPTGLICARIVVD
ncbi:hypothetical protein St703_21730 [Sporolactobacillus terrae]|uniref:Uncharacterized protein n=1 Tax=Sporolactobacillus terrae TaxID=269673 RepID=A0A5K7X3F7_9BACL|nr:hypothetical protein St703_21730 [Sporolactobacillus terrae]